MSGEGRWAKRQFDFGFSVDLYPELIERLRGTPARIEERVGSFPDFMLTLRDGESWSIQENAGHLLDLEPLFVGRLGEYSAGAEILRRADMSNRKTWQAQHNHDSIESILAKFRQERFMPVERLENWKPSQFGLSAIHPRLNVPMRLVDMMFFHAEHDDHHLARITDLARRLVEPHDS